MGLAQQKKITKSKKIKVMQHAVKKKLITPKEAANIFGFCEGTLANQRFKKLGCRFYKVNRKVLYDYDELESWAKRCPVLTMDSVVQENGQSIDEEVTYE